MVSTRPMPGEQAPSMTDVASLAGVSHQTVSRVLAGHPNVRAQTRARVLAAIEELGYRPNRAARALATGRTRTLGVVSMNSTLYGPASMLYGIEEAASQVNYSVTVASLRSIDRASLRQAVDRLLGDAVDGVVVIAPLVSAGQELGELPPGVPVVAVDGDPGIPGTVVRIDQEAGARAATEHLLAAGHRTVWHLAGPSDWLDARARMAGWRAALREAGAEEPPLLTGDWSAGSGYQAGQVLARVQELTGVFVANDQMALGVLRALSEHGRRVPGDISVVGFDDIPESGYFTPPLTTVRQDFGEVGRRSLRALLSQIDGCADAAQQILIDTKLIVRQSTARPRE
jgi:DNA-binding LacI/PurR family transcriptional regulator